MNYTALIVAISVIAMMCPSVYTIAWSKRTKAEHLPVLYAGLGLSGVTILGALMNSWNLMWAGLVGAFGLFLYVIFIYNKQ